MTIPKKKCSSCAYFLKWRNDGEKGSSLCQFYDGRTNSGNVCEHWKGKKYERKLQKFVESQRDIPPEFARVIDEHFWELLDTPLSTAKTTWNFGWWNGTMG